jgi:transposase-like protein
MKSHTVGSRRRWDEAEMRGLLRELNRSGLSQRAFAALHGVPLSTLLWWRQRLGKSGSGEEAALVPVTVVSSTARVVEAAGTVFEIEAASGLTIRVPAGFSGDDLARLVAVVGL